eukprot:g19405.t1
MAKVIYARLFDWLVWRINESISHRTQRDVRKIGLLDIYGFEVFDQDNQHIIDSLDKRPLGLFCLVDSECLMPSATDASLFSKIQNNFRSSKVIYKASRFGNTDFAVAHYAGEVVYSAETFLMKNTDKLSKELCRAFVVKQHECPSIYIYIVM